MSDAESSAWATRILARTYETLGETLPNARWLPQLHAFHVQNEQRVSGEIPKYGCGYYGCVYPTLDPTTVLKVTTDDTEGEFASTVANTLTVPICVRYRLASKIRGAKHLNRPIHLLWRESAEHVGGIIKAARNPKVAFSLLFEQQEAAYHAFYAVRDRLPERNELISKWLRCCSRMAEAPGADTLNFVGGGLVKNYEHHRILFGDLHSGNFGLVHRDGADVWVITDPGRIAIIND